MPRHWRTWSFTCAHLETHVPRAQEQLDAQLANGREMYLLPVGDVGTAVFISEMLQQIKSKGLNVDAMYAPLKLRWMGTPWIKKLPHNTWLDYLLILFMHGDQPPAMMPVASNVSCSLRPNLHKLRHNCRVKIRETKNLGGHHPAG